ncbi:hypothetical protein Tco_0221601 [Tanacetum coccineum]
MDLYHSRLTPDDLNDLIIKYKIPHDLHPQLPLEDFVMSELPDDAIGDWFSFSKRRAPSPVCINDNRSCMKHWKSGFFLIDRRAILDAMVWRHRDAAIDDPRPAAGSFNMANVHRLSAHVIKLRDMPEGVLVLSGLSHVWKSHVCDLVLRGADGNVMGIHDFLCLPDTTHPSLLVDNSDDDDDACVEIPLVTPIQSAAVIPSSRNRGRIFAAPAVEGLGTRDFFPFYGGPYYATYPEGGVVGNGEFTHEEWDDPYRPTFEVLTKEVFKDLAIFKTVVDQFLTPG